MWILDNEVELSIEELREKILSPDSYHTVYALDGPTRCGKTCFLKSLPQDRTVITGLYLLYEQLIDSLHQNTESFEECQRQLVSSFRNMGDILCFEDVDIVLAGRPTTQDEFARIIRNMSESRVVILTGIGIKERCSDFVKKLPLLHYCNWNDKQAIWVNLRFVSCSGKEAK